MADFQKMDRTWLCSVLFMDIVNYSSQPVDTQMKWKARFNGYLGEAIRDVPESDRVILDTGDGAAVCFLGAPEVAMFAALQMLQNFVHDEPAQQFGFRVRTGVNLGPVKLVKDLNGRLNAIGEGINSGQRVMSFAPDNQILVSQSYFEVVSCLSDDYKVLFKLKGIETDKHVREHTVYSLLPPATGTWQAPQARQPAPPEPAPPIVVALPPPVAAAPARPVAVAPEPQPRKSSALPLLLVGALVFLVAALVLWRLTGSGGAKASTPLAASTTAASSAAAEPAATQPAVSQPPAAQAPTEQPPAAQPAVAQPAVAQYPAAQPPVARYPTAQPPAAPPVAPQATQSPAIATKSYVPPPTQEQAPAPAPPPAESRVPQSSDPALDSLNQAIQANPNDAGAYLRRAQFYERLRQHDKAIQDFNQAIRLQPDNAQAYAGRANAKQMAGDGRGAAADRIYAYRLQGR